MQNLIAKSLVFNIYSKYLSEGYLRRTGKYLERFALLDLTHMIIMAYILAIGVEIPRIDDSDSLYKEFTELIYIKPSMVI